MLTTLTPIVPSSETFADAAALLDALGEPSRLKILWHLCQGELNVNGLCAATGKRQQAVSHHLTILKLREMVVLRRRGKSNYYLPTAKGREALLRNHV